MMFTPSPANKGLTSTSAQAIKTLVKNVSASHGKIHLSFLEWEEQVKEMTRLIESLLYNTKLIASLQSSLFVPSFWNKILWSRYEDGVRLIIGQVVSEMEIILAQLRPMQKRIADIYLLISLKVADSMACILNESFQTLRGSETLVDRTFHYQNLLKALNLEHKTRSEILAKIIIKAYQHQKLQMDDENQEDLDSLYNKWIEAGIPLG